MKHYVDITRVKPAYADKFREGELIVVQEKIDGSNASIQWNQDAQELVCFSRNTELSYVNTLRGFYEFVQSLDADWFRRITLDGRYIIFGEWLVKHTVSYPNEKMDRFYVFDVWDTVERRYLPWEETKQFSDVLGLSHVPVFYTGPFISWEHLMTMVGQTWMEAKPCGEGIVVKAQERLDSVDSSKSPAYVKIVAKSFSEVHQSRPRNVDPEKIAARERAQAMAETIITARRVEKMLEKFADEGVIPTDWDETNMKDIAKTLPRAIYEDCVKEEPETVEAIEDFGKICSSIVMKYVRAKLNER